MSENPLREMIKPSRLYPLVLIALMFSWWQFYLKPLKEAKIKMSYAKEGYFKTKEKEDIFSAVLSEYKHTVKGKTMGVISYSIHYFDEEDRNMKPQIDSTLEEFNNVFSTYVPTSAISEFNKEGKVEINSWISDLHARTSKIHNLTEGDFDPTVYPLVSFWGFGGDPNEDALKDTSLIDSLTSLVDYAQIEIKNNQLISKINGMKLDYGAVAKGYGVDVVADLLESNGINSYMVEVGGEIRVGNDKPSDDKWILAVEDVNTFERQGRIFINLTDKAMATSGSYRNFRTDSVTGEQYQHTINPRLGIPVRNNLLSVTVITDQCLEADALATGLMVMGSEKAIIFSERNSLDICLIYSENGEMKTYSSEGFKQMTID